MSEENKNENNVPEEVGADSENQSVENTQEDLNYSQLGVLLDIPVKMAVEIGRTSIAIRNLLQLNKGSVIELDKMSGEPLDVRVNGTLIAHGEVVVVDEKFGIRLTDVVNTDQRLKEITG